MKLTQFLELPLGDPAQPTDRTIAPAMEWLARRFGDIDRWRVLPIHSKDFPSGRYLRMYRVRNPSQGYEFAIKFNSERTRNLEEHTGLTTLRAVTSDCINPVHLDEKNRFFVLDWCPHPLLSDALHGANRASALRRAGAWLSHVHKSTQGPAPKSARIHRLSTSKDKKIRARLAAGLPTPTTMIHGDFHTGNLFAAPDQLLGFDREQNFYGNPYFDVAKILVNQAELRDKAALSGAAWDGSHELDRKAFFDGYGPIPEADLSVFDLTEDQVLFKLWDRRKKRKNGVLDTQMKAQGLLPDPPETRPGRLVETGWNTTPAPQPTGSLFARLTLR